jgi:hypothetical protein
MKTKLIKLSDTHYIVVDDSEIKEGDWFYNPATKEALFASKDMLSWNSDTTQEHKGWKKITHSTEPIDGDEYGACFIKVKQLNLSEIEEAINGYSVEKMAEKYVDRRFNVNPDTIFTFERLHRETFEAGFKAHQELVKDKLVIDVDKFKKLTYAFFSLHRTNDFDNEELEIKYERILNLNIQSLLPKTEWEVEFVEGKIKLL